MKYITPRKLIFFCGSTPRMLKSVCGSTPRDPLLICGSTPWVPCSDSMTWHYRHNGDSIFPFDTDPIGYKVATLPGGAWWQGGDVSVQATESPGLVTREPGPGCWGSERRSLQEWREPSLIHGSTPWVPCNDPVTRRLSQILFKLIREKIIPLIEGWFRYNVSTRSLLRDPF